DSIITHIDPFLAPIQPSCTACDVAAFLEFSRFTLSVDPIGSITLSQAKDELDAWIIALSLSSLLILYPNGNIRAIDAYFFGASAATASGINPLWKFKLVNNTSSSIDLKALKTYQQVYLYVIPTLGNLMVINIAVVVVRLWWFEKHLKEIAPSLLRRDHTRSAASNVEADIEHSEIINTVNSVLINGRIGDITEEDGPSRTTDYGSIRLAGLRSNPSENGSYAINTRAREGVNTNTGTSIQFADDPRPREHNDQAKALYIPPPWKRDRG
ncbi:hypothetical protein N7510_000414, partial [Penicillium lagena]|uniref:uncharacterized protein n=1 Tax=Penicillium lagena TaxID=94218 RepID=UPI0025400497